MCSSWKIKAWHAPFFIRLPFVPMEFGKATDEVIKAKFQGYSPKRGVIPPGITANGVLPVLPDQDKEAEKLLVNIGTEPLLGIAARYRRIHLYPRNKDPQTGTA